MIGHARSGHLKLGHVRARQVRFGHNRSGQDQPWYYNNYSPLRHTVVVTPAGWCLMNHRHRASQVC